MKDMFNTEFALDLCEAETERELDEILAALKPYIENQKEAESTEYNKMRLQQFRFALVSLRYLTKDANALLTYERGGLIKSSGSISIEFESIEFNDMVRFARAVEFADNIEIYPLVNGRVRMSLAFYGLPTLQE